MSVSCYLKILLLYVVLQFCFAGRFSSRTRNEAFLNILLNDRINMFTKGVDPTFFNTPSGRLYLKRRKKLCRIDEIGPEKLIGVQMEKDNEESGTLFWVEQYMQFRYPPTTWTPVCADNTYKKVFSYKPVLSLTGKRPKLCFQTIAISCKKKEVKTEDQHYFKMPLDIDRS